MIKKTFILMLLQLLLLSCQNNKTVNTSSTDSLTIGYNLATDVKIAAIYSLSGGDVVNNERGFSGTKLAVKEINKNGGLLGKKIYLEIYDDESSAAGSQKCMEKAVRDSVTSVLGCTYSSNALAAAPIAQAAKIPFITHIATNPNVTAAGDYIFRTCFINTFQSKLLAKFASIDLNLKYAAVIFEENNQYSIDLKDEFIKSFKQFGGKIAMEASYKKEDTDFSIQLEKIKNQNPAMLFIPAYTAKSGMIIRQAVNMNFRPIFVGGDGWSDRLFNYADSTADGSYFIDHWDPEILSDKSKTFVVSYKAEYGSSSIPNSDASLAYDAVYLLATAITKAGSFNKEAIKNELQKIKFTGVTGEISFNSERNPAKAAVIKKVNKTNIRFFKVVNL